jgi:hypothetical protein
MRPNIEEAARTAKHEIQRRCERVPADERQIGQLCYQNKPSCIVFFGHYECGSKFFRLEPVKEFTTTVAAKLTG